MKRVVYNSDVPLECLDCGKPMNRHLDTAPELRPKPESGAATICSACGAIFIFTVTFSRKHGKDILAMRYPTDEERARAMSLPAVVAEIAKVRIEGLKLGEEH